jgi:glycosyltransferase involved in cell wall biosynthesis
MFALSSKLKQWLLSDFAIVTPIRDGREFIDETILSVVSQAGPFTIRYHVQDGGSTDGTTNRLEQWKKWLDNDFPVGCNGVKFSFSSLPDAGLYDAVNKGFLHCGRANYMSWINSDDRYEPGAFISVAEWPCGTPTRRRWPRRQRPWVRAILVEAQVSSMKTRRSGSRSSWPSQSDRLAL